LVVNGEKLRSPPYGTASGGGTGNNGVVFKLTRTGCNWTETVLSLFPANWLRRNPKLSCAVHRA